MAKFSVYIGIDWANDKHDVCVQVANSGERSFEVIKHSSKSINEWITTLHKRYKGQIAVAIELSFTHFKSLILSLFTPLILQC